jgi:hypothetical protein
MLVLAFYITIILVAGFVLHQMMPIFISAIMCFLPAALLVFTVMGIYGASHEAYMSAYIWLGTLSLISALFISKGK